MTNIKQDLQKIYGNDKNQLDQQIKRYQNLDLNFVNHFGDQWRSFFSTPGRTEIGGNHTDHNHGRVIASSVDMDSIAVAASNDQMKVKLYSEGYDQPFEVDLTNLSVIKEEQGRTESLIRGIAAKFAQSDYRIGGFDCCMTSSVLPGSGLSSSASVEVLIGTVFNHLFNQGEIDTQILAQIGQYAENVYFGKPCGLMDQMACAVGGIISIDFKDPQNPQVKKINFNFEKEDFRLLIVDTGGNHADLTEDYASIPSEMKAAANICGVETMRDVEMVQYEKMLPDIRRNLGDRAALRGLHFIIENNRVSNQVAALENNDFSRFLSLVKESGNSSFKWLQNIYTVKNVNQQGIALALALSEKFLNEIRDGACRVHGGGFAGTIQVFLPKIYVEEYIKMMEPVFGAGCVNDMQIRPTGTTKL